MNFNDMEICYMGGKQAGVIGLLTLLAIELKIEAAVSYSNNLTKLLEAFNIKCYSSIKNKDFINAAEETDLLVSVHGREIVSTDLLSAPRLGCINVHPYLYKYKGRNPVEKALEEENFNASVGVHKMSSKVDEGEVIIEKFIDVSGSESVVDIYNRLYPYYSLAIIEALHKITGIE